MGNDAWRPLMAEFDEGYLRRLAELDLEPGGAVILSCPKCGQLSWMSVPKTRPDRVRDQFTVSCPTACGYYGEIGTFTPRLHNDRPMEYDTVSECVGCGVRFAANGVVVRRPCCAIENPREVMATSVRHIESRLATIQNAPDQRTELELLAGFLVSTFDGVMRSMLAIANENAIYFRRYDPNHSLLASMNALPHTLSFQNLITARERLRPTGWDMGAGIEDWDGLVSLFNKRHTIAHRLGVADQEYIARTGDSCAHLGKRVPLEPTEILRAAMQCKDLVAKFFGSFLS